MEIEELRSLIPSNKHDHEKVKRIKELGYPKIKPILPELLEWIQDVNWPIARDLIPFFQSIGNEIIPFLNPILNTEDYIWQHVCIHYLIQYLPPSGIMQFKEKLLNLRENATEQQRSEDLDTEATEILKLIGF